MTRPYNYHNKKFKVVSNSSHGEVDEGLIFTYQQHKEILTCTYSGTHIIKGHILGKVNPKSGQLEFTYHQINEKGNLSSGCCRSNPEILPSGKIRLYESWEWTSGQKGKGSSTLEEL